MGYVKSIELKMGKMRKSDSCVVYPNVSEAGWVFVQGKKLALMANLKDGRAIFNYSHGSQYPNRLHCQPGIKGARAGHLTDEQVELIKGAIPKSGDYVGSSVCRILVQG